MLEYLVLVSKLLAKMPRPFFFNKFRSDPVITSLHITKEKRLCSLKIHVIKTVD